jgi:2-phosphosulfolactate phosphatase
MPSLRVHLLPSHVAPDALADSACLVIDVLRATTTILYALAAGAREVRVCLEVDEARALAGGLPDGAYVLGGERKGLRIEGFHLGNSPSEYTPAVVGGKTVIFTTTNGTRALGHCDAARRVLVAAAANLQAVCGIVADEAQVDVVCAGRKGEEALEDVLIAGAIVWQLQRTRRWSLDDRAERVANVWTTHVLDRTPSGADLSPALAAALRLSKGGQHLMELGLAADIDLAARLVPVYKPAGRRVACGAE